MVHRISQHFIWLRAPDLMLLLMSALATLTSAVALDSRDFTAAGGRVEEHGPPLPQYTKGPSSTATTTILGYFSSLPPKLE